LPKRIWVLPRVRWIRITGLSKKKYVQNEKSGDTITCFVT
jgi:hypothetical protein